MTTYPTVTLSRREIDDLVRAEVAKRAGVLRSDVGNLRYKIRPIRRSAVRLTTVYGLTGVTASHS